VNPNRYRPAAFNVGVEQLETLKLVSKATGIAQSALVREAIDLIIGKYNAAPTIESSPRPPG
jgi:predicted DNA-binding protein